MGFLRWPAPTSVALGASCPPSYSPVKISYPDENSASFSERPGFEFSKHQASSDARASRGSNVKSARRGLQKALALYDAIKTQASNSEHQIQGSGAISRCDQRLRSAVTGLSSLTLVSNPPGPFGELGLQLGGIRSRVLGPAVDGKDPA